MQCINLLLKVRSYALITSLLFFALPFKINPKEGKMGGGSDVFFYLHELFKKQMKLGL